MAVFKSLKDHWGKVLFRHMKLLTRLKLSKAEFLKIICSEKVWDIAFSEKNVKSEFQKYGIIPVNSDAYPQHRHNANLLNRYNTWVDIGKPEITAEELDEIFVEETQKTSNKTSELNETSNDTIVEGSVGTFQGKKGEFIAYFIPDDEPDNLIPVSFDQMPSASTPNSASSTPGCSKTSSVSFKEVMLKRLDDVQNSHVRQQKPSGKRKKVNHYRSIVTNEEQFVAAEESENKKNKEKASKRKKEKADKSDEELAEILEEDTNSDSTFEDEEGKDLRARTIKFPPATEFESYDYLRKVWRDINPSTPESAIKTKFYFCSFFVDKNAMKKPKLFVGRVLNRFLVDKDGPARSLVLDCLKLAVGSA